MRTVKTLLKSQPTIEGAGVRLNRVFGHREISDFDPFLLLDHFGSDNPEDYIKGFPWHPHRGIQTVTYMLNGQVEHGDSLGNMGVIQSGDIQWMSAGSGIIHQEMPKRYDGLMQGFQLWVNMPARKKMTRPKYRGITKNDIYHIDNGDSKIKLVSGKFDGKKGPVTDTTVDIEYLDIELNGKFKHKTEKKTAFIFVIEGEVFIGDEKVGANHCALLSESGDVEIKSKNSRFLFIAGNPLNEPIAWGGPIVMNTEEELKTAFEEIHNGSFIKDDEFHKVHEEYYRD